MNLSGVISAFKQFAIAVVLFALIRFQSILVNILNRITHYYGYILIALTFFVLLYIYIYLASKLNIIALKKIKISILDLKIILLWTLILFGSKIIGGLILLVEHVSNTNNQIGLEQLLKNTPLFFIFWLTVISAPIMEEILFRGFFLKVFFKNYIVLGIIISSCLFGLAHHPTNLGSFFIYTAMGLILGLLYIKYQRIELTIALHVVNNFIAFIPYLYIAVFS